ncbi:MAG: glycosyltransferase [Muribaculaceae bacterium]|nr:glycosyltransferase [Muribaculaceae bacterium]
MSRLKSAIKPFFSLIGRVWPENWMKFRYFVRFKKPLDLKTPKNVNEKILYLSLKTDTTSWTDLSDKYLVRTYVKDKIGEDNLVKLYGKWQNANDIDWHSLPNSFVIKTNHGSGEITIVKDKSKLDIPSVVKYFNNKIKRPYGEIEGGKHYSRIKPLIIAEELLVNDFESAKYSSSIIDYKCWCFNGRCEYIWACINRNKNGADVMLYDRDWKSHPEFSIFNNHYRKAPIIPKPNNLDSIIEAAEKLAKPFPVVRVDLYSINNKIFFGEMTFTSLGGLMDYFTPEFLEKAGAMIDLNYKG